MSEVVKFTLKGLSATFRKPESNAVYFTYNNVHKIAILGILGAIIGENGYNYNALVKKENELPQFYNNLKDLKIAIKPSCNESSFVKKIQTFNNSVGYASDETGNNLIVDEQWLENPCWDIYILENNNAKYCKIKDYLVNCKCEYIPYLGKNEHFANISNVQVLNAKNVDNVDKIDTIFVNDGYTLKEDSFNFELYSDKEIKFEYKEILPTKLDEKLGYTDFKEFVYTNKNIQIQNIESIYEIESRNVYFF